VVWFFPQVLVFCPSSSAGCFQPALGSLFFHDFGCSTFPLPLPSLSLLRRAHAAAVWSSFSLERGREERACCWAHAAELLSSLWEGGKNKSMQLILGRGKGTRACSSFGEECSSLSLLAAFIPLLQRSSKSTDI